jgi:phage tail sheath protein FI
MAVQVSYPGVYIDEFSPGAPIEGVGTSTAAFIGTASSGPINKPTLVQSWDAFIEIFGGFIAEQPVSYLAPAVYGFFLNGGTRCYIVRVGTGVMAYSEIDSRQGGGTPDPAMIIRALQEGLEGNSISAEVADSSRLARLLVDAGETDTDLALAYASTNITAVSTKRLVLTVADNTGFAAGDRILLTNGTGDGEVTATAIVNSTVDTNSLELENPIAGSDDFAGGIARIADLAPGQRSLRLTVPAGIRLAQALPKGALIRITGGGTSEIHTVDASGGDRITLVNGLATVFDMSDNTNLVRVASLEFNLTVTDAGKGASEVFEELSMNPNHPNYWNSSVTSELVTVEEPAAPPAPIPDDTRPAAAAYHLSGGTADDRAAAWSAITSAPDTYLDLLKAYDDIALISVPGATDPAVQQAVVAHCEAMYDRFAILDSIKGATPGNGIRDQFADVRSQKGFAALYYPWILARNPLSGKDELWPPSGHITGIYARTDAQRGVHKAPANTNIKGALGVETRLTNEEQGPLNLEGINVIRVFPGQGQPVVWGARTTAGDLDRNWQYVNIRRLFLYLEESIQSGIRWAVFEPNNLQLWQKLKRSISEFLTRVWRDGALFGATAQEAFFVRIDEALNPASTQALGRLYIEVGVRPTYPAEFIILKIGIWHGGSEVSES